MVGQHQQGGAASRFASLKGVGKGDSRRLHTKWLRRGLLKIFTRNSVANLVIILYRMQYQKTNKKSVDLILTFILVKEFEGVTNTDEAFAQFCLQVKNHIFA